MLIDAYKNKGISLDKCTGCTTCANGCAEGSIHMEMDGEGFCFPKVDLLSCVSCGFCVKVCPVLNRPESISFEKRLFSGYDKSLVYVKKCSSGGIFGLLSEKVIAQDGVIYGAAFDAMSYEVHHVSSDTVPMDEIYRSKYVQSQIGDTYKRVKKDLIAGRQVLFCGCPCQTEGLRNFLHNEYDSLLIVDFLCHGVPSPGVFKEMLKDVERDHGKIHYVTFREKGLNVAEQHMYFYMADSHRLAFKSLEHYFYYLFLHNCILRKSCMTCDRAAHRVSDLTLADDWSQSWLKNPQIGVSLVQVNTEIGMAAFDGVRKRFAGRELPANERVFISAPHRYSIRDREKTFALYQKSNGLSRLKRRYRFVKFRNEIKAKAIAALSKTYHIVKR